MIVLSAIGDIHRFEGAKQLVGYAGLGAGIHESGKEHIEKRITTDVYSVLGVRESVKSRKSYGGTAPENVRREARRWLKRLAKEGPAG